MNSILPLLILFLRKVKPCDIFQRNRKPFPKNVFRGILGKADDIETGMGGGQKVIVIPTSLYSEYQARQAFQRNTVIPSNKEQQVSLLFFRKRGHNVPEPLHDLGVRCVPVHVHCALLQSTKVAHQVGISAKQ